jgi:hypothetical protein
MSSYIPLRKDAYETGRNARKEGESRGCNPFHPPILEQDIVDAERWAAGYEWQSRYELQDHADQIQG